MEFDQAKWTPQLKDSPTNFPKNPRNRANSSFIESDNDNESEPNTKTPAMKKIEKQSSPFTENLTTKFGKLAKKLSIFRSIEVPGVEKKRRKSVVSQTSNINQIALDELTQDVIAANNELKNRSLDYNPTS